MPPASAPSFSISFVLAWLVYSHFCKARSASDSFTSTFVTGCRDVSPTHCLSPWRAACAARTISRRTSLLQGFPVHATSLCCPRSNQFRRLPAAGIVQISALAKRLNRSAVISAARNLHQMRRDPCVRSTDDAPGIGRSRARVCC